MLQFQDNQTFSLSLHWILRLICLGNIAFGMDTVQSWQTAEDGRTPLLSHKFSWTNSFQKPFACTMPFFSLHKDIFASCLKVGIHDSYSGQCLLLHYKMIFVLAFSQYEGIFCEKVHCWQNLSICEGFAVTAVLVYRQQWQFHHPSFLWPAPYIFPGDFLQPPTAAQRPAGGSLCTALPQSFIGTAQQRCRAKHHGPHAAMEGLTCPWPAATYSPRKSSHGSRKIT